MPTAHAHRPVTTFGTPASTTAKAATPRSSPDPAATSSGSATRTRYHHDITVARLHALPALYPAAARGLPTLTDKGYAGAGIGIHDPTKGYEGFCYDGAGNRTKYLNATSTTCSSGTAAATFTYNGSNELTAATGVTPTGATLSGTGYSYDGNGNQTSAKSQIGLNTSYNAQNASSSFTPAGGSAIPQS